ncbi:replication initiation protein [Variovorax sp. 770b2]|uniref:replication initiation protein n=1 Tax=Variovorax sp. 770b2 TaxID=1566271 RepID=UPI00210DA503|nr:replication initiation protein [Variovorax sp. 770b2]
MSKNPPRQKQHSMVLPEEAEARHVSMSNRLARSAQGLNLAEKRLVALGLAGTDSVPLNHLLLAANAGWKMKVTAMEYATTFEVDPTTAYEQLKSASEKLFERYVRYEVRGRRGQTDQKKFRWVSGAHYAPGEGYVELNFSPEIAPHLLGLRSQFTTYKLRQAAAFDSVYAWRLFELLKSWQSTGFYTTAIEDFWDAMEAPPSCRKDFKALRVRVLEPAVQAISAKAGMLVEWKPVRSGSRRVTSLEFRFRADPQQKLPIEEDEIAMEAAKQLLLGHGPLMSD